MHMLSMLEKHLTPSEKREYENAEQNLRHHRRKVQLEQKTLRTLKNRARKRRDNEGKSNDRG